MFWIVDPFLLVGRVLAGFRAWCPVLKSEVAGFAMVVNFDQTHPNGAR
jgi:hypothetical protein